MKKFTALLLSLVLTLAISVPAFAAEPQQVPPDESSTDMEDRINLYDRTWFKLGRAASLGKDKSDQHYKHNKGVGLITGYVNGQSNYSDYLVGSTNMSGVGCEIIATHNALKLSGNSSELCSVIRSFETNGYLMANGYVGSDPYAIGEYLSAKSVSYTEYPDNDSYSSFAKAVAKSLSAKERKTFIISFWNSKHIGDGLHTVAFRTSNGSIVAYNRYSNVSTTKTYSSLNDFFAGEVGSDRYITGYKL